MQSSCYLLTLLYYYNLWPSYQNDACPIQLGGKKWNNTQKIKAPTAAKYTLYAEGVRFCENNFLKLLIGSQPMACGANIA